MLVRNSKLKSIIMAGSGAERIIFAPRMQNAPEGSLVH
jgi:hypothetical protein